ncbi:DUF3575 domain-containing protein [Salinispirillum marinum]|uniref:DUF3575 domain-containing protein n=2 Tax=Saccharospirillaceae TaxID=255527 RepID=A0ABV8BFX7_9GAMM
MSIVKTDQQRTANNGRRKSPWTGLIVLGVFGLVLANSAQALGLRQNAGTDLIWWGLGYPNVGYEYRLSDHWSFSGDLAFNAFDLEQGIILNPAARVYLTGALRTGPYLEAGARLPTNDDILTEIGVGYAYWVDRIHLTPAAKVRHDGSWQIELSTGLGWY